MTTRKKTIAVPVPGSGVLGRYDALVASGVLSPVPHLRRRLGVLILA